MARTETLQTVVGRLTREGELYERLPESKVRCVACGHRCLILDGQRGICKVRYNEEGRLLVPTGYVAALQLDPVEKKPFFHAYPGSRALSFGMLGCDYHCGYCFVGSTRILVTTGPTQIQDLFDRTTHRVERSDATIGFPENLEALTHAGRTRRVRKIFRHHYSGRLISIQPAFLPEFECTPDHRLLVIPRPKHGRPPGAPTWLKAGDITTHHCLAIPIVESSSLEVVLDVADLIFPLVETSRMRRGMGRVESSAEDSSGQTVVNRNGLIFVEEERVRLFNEHRPGIPSRIPLDNHLAALLGYYCAEGCVWRDRKRRVNSAMLTFSFGKKEPHLVETVQRLLKLVFGVEATVYSRRTTTAIVCYKASLGLLFESLCGSRATGKRVPDLLFRARTDVTEAFLNAYVEGDGYRSRNGQVSTATVSEELAWGLAELCLRLGRVPTLRRYKSQTGPIEGRTVRRAAAVFHVRWWDDPGMRRLWQGDRYYFVPVRSVRSRDHEGFVYNMEVEEDHTYLANFFATANCQNYITSQALRDPIAGVPPQEITPKQIVNLALHNRARVLTSTYNEPLITSEWAVEVFREGKAQGLVCSYVSNGNATPEVLQYIRPWVDLYKVDLKGFNDKQYRKLGGLLQTVLDSIRLIREKDFWLEIVTLVIPGFNDSNEELRDIARFLVSVSPDIPWHVTAFHQDYKMTDRENTTVRTLLRAAEIGRVEGLHFVYAGNLPGHVGLFENTYCPSCKRLLIERVGYTILQDLLTPSRGVCPSCSARIPGVWG